MSTDQRAGWASLLLRTVTEALTGFLSAYFVSRLLTPVIAGSGLAATIGAGATAQLGAMRINEEIIKSRCPS
jgi:ABC-type transporter Mla maintaining outer membrane lipid asymmetry permease subunit MlaE